MANIASQIKRNRQNEKRRLRNRDYRGSARTAVKDALNSISAGQDSPASLLAAISALDRAAQKGAIHHRNAARRKSRLLKRLAAMRQSGQLTKPRDFAVTEKAAAPSGTQRAERIDSAPKRKVEAKKAPEKKAAPKKTAAKKTTKK